VKVLEFSLFDTVLGVCGLVWGDGGVTGVQLPEGDEAQTRARILSRFPGATAEAPPAAVQQAIAAIVALLGGQPVDLRAIALDWRGIGPFERQVYEVTRAIPPGATLTYGEVAARVGSAGAARAVGHALGRNPFAIIVPCHRVLAAGGKAGGFSARGGASTKLRMLAIEGVRPGQLELFGAEAPEVG
jgi:methylated-DNA-[protein]-cysteine S-methyltransferase